MNLDTCLRLEESRFFPRARAPDAARIPGNLSCWSEFVRQNRPLCLPAGRRTAPSVDRHLRRGKHLPETPGFSLLRRDILTYSCVFLPPITRTQCRRRNRESVHTFGRDCTAILPDPIGFFDDPGLAGWSPGSRWRRYRGHLSIGPAGRSAGFIQSVRDRRVAGRGRGLAG
jgi:hypothetical protein